jgi:hypothetical protein
MDETLQVRPGNALPALQQAALDRETLEALFRDLSQCVSLLAVLPKGVAQGHAAEQGISLEAAKEGFIAGTLRGVQIRYLFEGQEWCDTLLNSPSGPRLVRINTSEARAHQGS